MKMTYIYGGLIVLLAVGIIAARNMSDKQSAVPSTEYDTFAQCLTDAGAKFYGAFWCPHCQDQKKLLKNSKFMPYIECSTPDRQQTKICVDEGITGYPTWKFADGSTLDGAIELSVLSEKTNCALPAS